VLGGIVSIVTAFVPFSPVLGGALAGYLQREDGARVGAYAGVVAAVPLVLIGGFLLAFLPVFAGFVSMAGPRGPMGGGILLWFGGVVVLLFAVGYTVGLSALGGVLGVYVREEL
jgi:hypothetical protein